MRRAAAMAVFLFSTSPIAAQTVAAADPPASWSLSASMYIYQVRDDSNYAQPTVTADRGRLHLEARYNNEDLETGSVWAGFNAAGGDTVTWELTPMLGAVFGRTNGVAPGYRASLGWRKIELSSEGNYLFDVDDSSESFFYNWSEVTVAPAEWWRAGLVTQRTRVYQTARDIQRGLLFGVSVRSLDLAVYLFNPDDSAPNVVFSIAVAF
jgi:hypothetical protein